MHAHRFEITDEQLTYAYRLVAHSVREHRVHNIWDTEKLHVNRTEELRLTGTLGEIIFADLHGLGRPQRSFGADDGQDYGSDYRVTTQEGERHFDVKTMSRNTGALGLDYVLNIPSRNITRTDVLTTDYVCISLHPRQKLKWATLVGEVSRHNILSGEKGILYKAGSVRTRADGSKFKFYSDTYEIRFAELSPASALSAFPIKSFEVEIK